MEIEKGNVCVEGRWITRLSVTADPAFVRVVTAFTEQSALSLGFDHGDALALTLASEEIFSYACGGPSRGVEMGLTCRGRGYCVDLTFRFAASEFDIAAFNLTSKPSVTEDGLVEETGLLIASRMVDHFDFSMNGGGVELTLSKDKTYPEVTCVRPEFVHTPDSFEIRAPDIEEIKALFCLAADCQGTGYVTPDISHPGKLVDMMVSGEYESAVAAGPGGEVLGGVLWHDTINKLIEFYGPYTAHGPLREAVSRSLTERIISANARKNAVGLICRLPTPDLPLDYFERLGSLTLVGAGEQEYRVSAYFRLLREDPGASIWCHQDLEEYLRDYYKRFAFAREIRTTAYAGERIPGRAALAARFNRMASSAFLRPVWFGVDAEETLLAYGDTLQSEGFSGIFFIMDLGKQWHCGFTPALAHAGFTPQFVVPYGGKSDIVIFQRAHRRRP